MSDWQSLLRLVGGPRSNHLLHFQVIIRVRIEMGIALPLAERVWVSEPKVVNVSRRLRDWYRVSFNRSSRDLIFGKWLKYGLGTYFLRNLRLRIVIRPEPCTRITYWTNCQTFMTVPARFHILRWDPFWFSRRTSSTDKGGNCFVCSLRSSCALWWRFLKASSRVFRMSIYA